MNVSALYRMGAFACCYGRLRRFSIIDGADPLVRINAHLSNELIEVENFDGQVRNLGQCVSKDSIVSHEGLRVARGS